MDGNEPNKEMIAYCGLYCAACKRHTKNGCEGCRLTYKTDWCKVKQCNIQNNTFSCADCDKFENVNECPKFNSVFSKVFSFIFKSNRKSNIDYIRDNGYEAYAAYMASNNITSFKNSEYDR
ncbi:DUF3795 domain-containing protein [bacterium]